MCLLEQKGPRILYSSCSTVVVAWDSRSMAPSAWQVNMPCNALLSLSVLQLGAGVYVSCAAGWLGAKADAWRRPSLFLHDSSHLHLERWQLGGQDAKALLQRDPFPAELVIRAKPSGVRRLGGVSLGIHLLRGVDTTASGQRPKYRRNRSRQMTIDLAWSVYVRTPASSS